MNNFDWQKDNDFDDETNIEPENLLFEIKTTKVKLKSVHNKLIQGTTEVGFSVEGMEQLEQNVTALIGKPYPLINLQPIYNSISSTVKTMNKEINNIETNLGLPFAVIHGLAQNVRTVCTSTGSIVTATIPDFQNKIDYPSSLNPEVPKIIQILEKLDLSLADSYQEIEQVYYGTNADNTRAAISTLRQTFDHFFNVLAPDADVRRSVYWKKKMGEKDELQIYRSERIKYAIFSNVNNSNIAESLSNDLKLILNSYKVLNSLHKRGKLNNEAAKEALFTVKHFLERFAEAIK